MKILRTLAVTSLPVLAMLLIGPADAAAKPMLSVANAKAVSEAKAPTFAVFVLRLSAASSDSITVGYQTKGGSAKTGKDFKRASGFVTFAAGETKKTVKVKVLSDHKTEPTEKFRLMLVAPAELVTMDDNIATARILDDD